MDKYFIMFSFAKVPHAGGYIDRYKLSSGYVPCSKGLCLVLDT